MNPRFAILCAIMCLANTTHAVGATPPETDPVSIEWIQLLPPAAGDTARETYSDERVENVRNPQLGVFRLPPGAAPRPAWVVCPGGGYHINSIVKEGYEVARWFNARGIDAYVLKYRMKEFGYPAPLVDVTRAVRHLRANAESLGIDPDRIGVLGFSAGGHVAGMAATLHDSPDALAGDALDAVSARPDFAVLVYPVLAMEGPYVHAGSRHNLLGANPDAELLHGLSLTEQVDGDTPPVFLMHTANDAAVPVENSLHFAEAMARHDRPFALHVYPDGPHGIGMRPGFGAASEWPQQLHLWLEGLGLVSSPGSANSPE